MSSLNKVQIIGRLGRDPDTKAMLSGDLVCNLSIATDEVYKDKNGDQQKNTEWHRVVLFKRLAEVADQYLSKGGQVYIEGNIKTRKWKDRDGNDRYTTEIRGQRLIMLGAKGDEQSQVSKPKPAAPAQADGEGVEEDDILF